jgi:hypothetical protein
MSNWSIKTKEIVDGQTVVRGYEFWALDYEAALNRSWHLDGVATEIKNKDKPSEKHDIGAKTWSGGGTNP